MKKNKKMSTPGTTLPPPRLLPGRVILGIGAFYFYSIRTPVPEVEGTAVVQNVGSVIINFLTAAAAADARNRVLRRK